MQARSCVCSRNGAAARVSFRPASARRHSRGARLAVVAKVDLQGGPRVIRGKCFVTKDVSAGCQASVAWNCWAPSQAPAGQPSPAAWT